LRGRADSDSGQPSVGWPGSRCVGRHPRGCSHVKRLVEPPPTPPRPRSRWLVACVRIPPGAPEQQRRLCSRLPPRSNTDQRVVRVLAPKPTRTRQQPDRYFRIGTPGLRECRNSCGHFAPAAHAQMRLRRRATRRMHASRSTARPANSATGSPPLTAAAPAPEAVVGAPAPSFAQSADSAVTSKEVTAERPRGGRKPGFDHAAAP
jgi:hypothetical protein